MARETDPAIFTMQEKNLFTQKLCVKSEKKLCLKIVVLPLKRQQGPSNPFGSTRHIPVDVAVMKRIAARLVPKVLNFSQSKTEEDVAREMVGNAANDPTFIKRITTGGESQVYDYNVESVQHVERN